MHDRDDLGAAAHEPANGGIDRREFLRLTGASLALAGLDGCARMPAEHILPYVDNRPELTPGVAQHYATAMSLDGYATGLIVESHAGRPTKIEGNPDHPASLGASGAIEQASVLQLYDPDRAKHARIGNRRSTWSQVAATLTPTALRARVGARGAGLRLLLEPTSSPLDEELLTALLETYPDARIHMYAPFVTERPPDATVRQYDISSADVILAVATDFLAAGPFHLRYARQFADRRRLAQPTDAMNRLYVIESGFTPTGAAADHRFAARPRDVPQLLQGLLGAVGGGGSLTPPGAPPWIAAVARDLEAHRGRSVVIADDAPAEVQRLADAINDAIGAAGRITWRTPSPLIGQHVRIDPFADLVSALERRSVDTLVIVGGNPCYATPAALGLGALIRAVPNAGYVGMYENETAECVRWFVPLSHYLESWGDARAYDGTLSLVQPLVNPLYESVSPAELYSAMRSDSAQPAAAYDLLRASWLGRTSANAEAAWADALQRGVVAGTAFTPVVSSANISSAAIAPTSAPPQSDRTIDVAFALDPKIHDGSFANNGWLQELPSPVTQLMWGNAAILSPATAGRVKLGDGDVVTLSRRGQSIALPVLIVPGHADEAVTLHLGYGRTGAESAASGVGANAYRLLPDAHATAAYDVTITPGGSAAPLVVLQSRATLDPRAIEQPPIRSASLDEYRAAPSSVGQRPSRVLSLYPEAPKPVEPSAVNQWAMTIDLTTCTGCGACVVACQAENNIPVVGASESRNGRAMHWIRIDRFFAGREAELAALLQPMLCQHCERAPCEYVCPVEATVHSDDGLNEMVYNRCVGTRFCSNNCPYKVRRFNWYDYNAKLTETEIMVKNPNVTVRERGVMEKCTFCVQRIREAEIAAGREGKPLRGSDVHTACQQACPSNAIVFGSLTEADSEVVRRRNEPRAYAALYDLGTEPRVRYLARIRNTNDEITGGA